MKNKINGINQRELSTPIVYARIKIKIIIKKIVSKSLYFINKHLLADIS